ncbi:hypothetical protein [Mycolicibacterium sp.]|uniref:GNAT family N-acetyltransferase n=1 Tax=Mycolicibacterium sp. TaxID=2320850 RepID=UPI001A1DF1FE|nr:hypothetical protein [Mycolicibacterium sp.]MBJ7336913.1 hypothetical protein [Mycolicibacterium sp.]
MSQEPFVPANFEVPRELRTERFRLEPLGPQHNERDLAAWMSSIGHIQSSPGFVDYGWPPNEGFTPEANLGDLIRHAGEFERRVAFAYTVLRPDSDDVIGCVYLDPGPEPGSVAVRSWVTADVADLDPVVRQTVRTWLAESWPFDAVVYAG